MSNKIIDAPLAGDPAARRAGAVLTIDLEAAAENYRILCRELAGVPSAAVVKADAYGLGLKHLAPAFAKAGAQSFFVATIDEGLSLRPILTEAGLPEAEIHILNGPLPGTEREIEEARLIPVLNSLPQAVLWREHAAARGLRLKAALQVDTGMSRLGFSEAEMAVLEAAPDDHLAGIEPTYIISHLACADEPDNPMNGRQLARFRRALTRLPEAKACLANSSGIFLGPEFHFDLARPGVALYGINPTPGKPNPMRQVVRLRARILQVREIDPQEGVGYGATYRAPGPCRIATVAAGYADGYLRHLSNSGHGVLGGRLVPQVGRVSMDSITFDVSALPEGAAKEGDYVDLLGPDHDADALAREAGTIGYEILTALGARYHRVYLSA